MNPLSFLIAAIVATLAVTALSPLSAEIIQTPETENPVPAKPGGRGEDQDKKGDSKKEAAPQKANAPKSDCPNCKAAKDGACEKCKKSGSAGEDAKNDRDKMPELKKKNDDDRRGDWKGQKGHRDEMRKRFEEMRKRGGPWVENKGDRNSDKDQPKKQDDKNPSQDLEKSRQQLEKTSTELKKAQESLHLAHKELGNKALQIRRLEDQVKNYQSQLARANKAMSLMKEMTGDQKKLAAALTIERKKNEALKREVEEIGKNARKTVEEIQLQTKKRIAESEAKAKKSIDEARAMAAKKAEKTAVAPKPAATKKVEPKKQVARKPEPKKVSSPTLEIAPIRYDKNSAVNYPERDRALADVSALLKRSPKARIKIIGHADDSKYESTNKEISENRAKFLASFLRVNGGFSKTTITYQGAGNSAPEKKGAENRRVTFEISN